MSSMREKAEGPGRGAVEGRSTAVRGEGSPLLSLLDRRSFLQCALASGAALGVCEFARFPAAIPAWAAPQKQDDSRFTVEAKFYQKLPTTRRSSASCVRANARWATGNAAIAACARIAAEPTTRWCTRGCAPRTSIPSRRSLCSTTCPGRSLSRWPRPAATSTASSARTGTSRRSRPEQVPAEYAPPQRIADLAKQYNCPTIAYTYSEPVVFSEYLMDAADAGHEAGVRSVVVSNGYMQEEALKTAYGKMDAVKIDLKAFTESYYKDVVIGELKPVLDSLVTLRKMGKWTEIVYLVVPTLNDSDAEFRGLAHWIKTNLGVDVPLHFTQFHPEYLLKNLPITPVPTLERAKAIADAEGLHYVYIGNVPGHPAQNTYCPKCRRMLVERVGFTASQMLIRKGSCPFCRQPIPGIWHA